MTETVREPVGPPSSGTFRAMVVASSEQRCSVRVLESAWELDAVRCAVVGYEPRPGDRVLVQLLADRTAYVTGVLHAGGPRSLNCMSGARATLECDHETGDAEKGGAETLCIRDQSGRLVCEFDTASGRLTVHAGAEVALSLPEQSLRLEARQITLSAERMQLAAKELVGEFADALWTAERWQLRATRLQRRVRDEIVEVENSLQTRAGRIRSVVVNTWEVLSGRTRLQSKDDTSVDGKRILLG